MKSITRRLSQAPFAILERVLAESGAIKKISAHFLKSIWRTGSPFYFHYPHSSLSINISTPYSFSFIYSSINVKALSVEIILMLKILVLRRISTISNILMVATEPLTPIKRFFLCSLLCNVLLFRLSIVF